jgi:hypothetical protein
MTVGPHRHDCILVLGLKYQLNPRSRPSKGKRFNHFFAVALPYWLSGRKAVSIVASGSDHNYGGRVLARRTWPMRTFKCIANRALGDRMALLRQLMSQLGDLSAGLPELLGELIDRLVGRP